MNKKIKVMSNHKFLFGSILGVAFIVLTLILVSTVYIAETQEQSSIERNTQAWANTLAQLSLSYLVENENNALNAELKKLVAPTDINYVHVYKKNDDEQITYFTGYNKNIYFPSIPDKIEQIQTLSSFRYQNDHLELVVKIAQDEITQGYLYIQVSTKHIEDFKRELTFDAVLLLLLGLTLFLLLTIIIKKKINQSITTITESVQAVSHSKNYHHTIKPLSILEFDVLAQNITFLLNKTARQLNKADEKHQQILLENKNLEVKVQTRTDALKESNQELLSTLEKLHQFQGQLVETEKMASLGDMVAGIAHEVNTPIGLGVTASSLLSDRLIEIKQAFEDKSLKSSQLKKFLNQGEENIGIIYRNLERAAKLISGFKKVAVDQSSVDTRVFNVKELIEEVSITLKGKLNKLHIDLNIDCAENLVVESKPGPLNQILLNLILNSIIHGFENRPDGVIEINVIYLSDQLHFSYKDNGNGISESIKTKVFEPFTTTKRGSGGSGLGLHLVYNIVTQALNGHIDFDSSVGVGTTFNITFPALLISEQ
ncbi:HAMP domain-containing histidine kinase [Colwellia sp. MSW7]|uniref:histidine kinase n=1 Tax=Colwellia maritima TaxID=2912588 RepID=A0ABS9WYN2_9GAMM|nr:HAMP domain-containing sensor histidine kinase [Colwellia maritima]MCI2283102.1 HAMP domain-containing histidine kinase [Colwellia maritima]